MQYAFILGRNPSLSRAEIQSVFPNGRILVDQSDFLILEHSQIDVQSAMNRLGGTIKVALVLGQEIAPEIIARELKKIGATNKLNFGVSFYNSQPSQLGMQVKGILKAEGVSSRLVVSRDKALSSVVVAKNKCHEFLILGGEYLAQTLAVQDFEEYGARDFGRPSVDAYSGMLPPKLAKMMINLSGAPLTAKLLDPFCGSGTVLTEALAMGYKNLIGSDASARAVADTQKNIQWLTEKLRIKNSELRIFATDVRKLSQELKNNIDAIVTEPALGPALRGEPREQEIKPIALNLEKLYLAAFAEFEKIVKRGGRVVMVIPEWHLGAKIIRINLDEKISTLGFKRLDAGDLIYKRADQKVWRQITIWQK